MKITRKKLQQIIKEELERTLSNNKDDEPVIEGTLMEVTGFGVLEGIVLAWAALNVVDVTGKLAWQALRRFVDDREVKELEKKARELDERTQTLIQTLVKDPEFEAILKDYNKRAMALKPHKGERSPELQDQRKKLKELGIQLSQQIKLKARDANISKLPSLTKIRQAIK